MKCTPFQKLLNVKNLIGIEKYQEEYVVTSINKVFFSKSSSSFTSNEEFVTSCVFNPNSRLFLVATKSKLITLSESLEKLNELKFENSKEIFKKAEGFLVFYNQGYIQFNGKKIEKKEEIPHFLEGFYTGEELHILIKEQDKYTKMIIKEDQILKQDVNNVFIHDQGNLFCSNGNLFIKENKFYGLFQNPILKMKIYHDIMIILFKEDIITLWDHQNSIILESISFEEKIEKIIKKDNQVFIYSNEQVNHFEYILPNIDSSFILTQSKKTKEYLIQEIENQIDVSSLIKNSFNRKEMIIGKWNYQGYESLNHPNYVNEMAMKYMKQKNWNEFQLLLKTGIVSSKSILPKLLESQNHEILLDCLENMIDISEYDLISLIHFIFNLEDISNEKFETFLKKIILYPYYTDILLTKYLKLLPIDYFLCLFKLLKKMIFYKESLDSSILWVRMLLDSKLNEILMSNELLNEMKLIQKLIVHHMNDQSHLNSIVGVLKSVTEKKSIPQSKRNTNYKVKIIYY